MDEPQGYLPVDGSAVAELERAASALDTARRSLAEATRALIELSDDMKTDAVRRLAERGASSAQVERYEDAYRACASGVQEQTSALADACARLERAVRIVRG